MSTPPFALGLGFDAKTPEDLGSMLSFFGNKAALYVKNGDIQQWLKDHHGRYDLAQELDEIATCPDLVVILYLAQCILPSDNVPLFGNGLELTRDSIISFLSNGRDPYTGKFRKDCITHSAILLKYEVLRHPAVVGVDPSLEGLVDAWHSHMLAYAITRGKLMHFKDFWSDPTGVLNEYLLPGSEEMVFAYCYANEIRLLEDQGFNVFDSRLLNSTPTVLLELLVSGPPYESDAESTLLPFRDHTAYKSASEMNWFTGWVQSLKRTRHIGINASILDFIPAAAKQAEQKQVITDPDNMEVDIDSRLLMEAPRFFHGLLVGLPMFLAVYNDNAVGILLSIIFALNFLPVSYFGIKSPATFVVPILMLFPTFYLLYFLDNERYLSGELLPTLIISACAFGVGLLYKSVVKMSFRAQQVRKARYNLGRFKYSGVILDLNSALHKIRYPDVAPISHGSHSRGSQTQTQAQATSSVAPNHGDGISSSDAVRIANDSYFGLSGGVTSASDERALSVARRIRTGTINVNGGVFYSPDAPFGGYKQSGLGREMGAEGFEEYLETKTIALGV